MFREKLKQAAWQLSVLIVSAGLIAIGVNHFRGDGIELVGDWSAPARFAGAAEDGLVIGLDTAGRLFEQDAALFVDARPQDQYARGHIPGALSLPWQEAHRYFMALADKLDQAAMIITYCDGEACDLSHELALFLKEMQFDNVRELVNGWSAWRQAGLPIQTGE